MNNDLAGNGKRMSNIYVFWTGTNEMTENRKESLASMRDSGLNVRVILPENLNEYIDESKLHPAYECLNLAHRADYLRCYFMHHFGGGYADIKKISKSWMPAIKKLQSSDWYWVAGYREVSRHGVANLYHSSIQLESSFIERAMSYTKWRWLQLNYRHLIGNGAFFFKPNTELTARWWAEVNNRLDHLCEDLFLNPAIYPKERGGQVYEGTKSNYPVPWSYILGDILQPLVLRYAFRVLKDLPPPEFNNYQ